MTLPLDPGLPVSVIVVCANDTQAEVHLYHFVPSELSGITNACGTPASSFADETRLDFVYTNLPTGSLGETFSGLGGLMSGLFGVPGQSNDDVSLAAIDQTTSSAPLVPPLSILVQRHVATTASAQTVDFANGATPIPFTVGVTESSDSPDVFWLTTHGTLARVTPYAQNEGGAWTCAGAPAAIRLPNDVHVIHDLEDESATPAATELYHFMAIPADIQLPKPVRVLAPPTVSDNGTASNETLRVTWTPMPGAIGYLFDSYGLPGPTTPPTWTSFVTVGYLAGASTYEQPDLSSAQGFSPSWLQVQGLQWGLGAVVTTRTADDLVGTAALLPAVPSLISPIRPGPTTDGLEYELPQQNGSID